MYKKNSKQTNKKGKLEKKSKRSNFKPNTAKVFCCEKIFFIDMILSFFYMSDKSRQIIVDYILQILT